MAKFRDYDVTDIFILEDHSKRDLAAQILGFMRTHDVIDVQYSIYTYGTGVIYSALLLLGKK